MSKFYHKEKVIGSGTYGNVWLIKSKVNNNLFVLKEVNLASMNTTEIQQALTEVTVLSRCRHRNIIKYKDAVIDHKRAMLSIIMEYADGGDLFSAIMNQRGVPFKEQTVITWFIQICLALQYIHHKGILHRDLKTKNIFLTRERQIKVGDFGIARCLMETNELATTAIGTPYYLSPEICQQKPYNHKSDIWALGCILFEMAALSHPFQACNFPQLLSLILMGKRKELPGYCSTLMNDLVQLLLDDNPETRPSADEILAVPSLQPYLSELWIIQTNENSTSMSKLLNQKISVSRRHSLCEDIKEANDASAKRRASISSVQGDSKATKSRFGFVSKSKNIPVSKLATGSRSHSVKGYKNSPKSCVVKKEQFFTYKVLNPLTLKEKIKVLTSGLKSPRKEKDSVELSYYRKHDESDRGYQSEDHLIHVSEKALDITEANTANQPKTSTKMYIDASDFRIESLVNEVFDSNKSQKKMYTNSLQYVNQNTHSACPHSECQQCMLDMLWKNRIRGTIGLLMKTDERSELIRKLQVVFGEDFDTVYNILISNWERSENDTPKSLKDITNSLSYSQLQHLPLMMQLIQLDLVPN